MTVIVEAAFQHKLWAPRLNEISNIANLKLLICDIDPLLALERRQRRLLENPKREKFHGEKVKGEGKNTDAPQISAPPVLDVPILRVNTTNEYDPELETILQFIADDRK